MNTTITVSPIDNIDTLLAAIRAEPKHKYPYRVFVAAGDYQPFFERFVLIVHREGGVFFRHPVEGPKALRLEDSEGCRIALDAWLSDAREAVELHPSATTLVAGRAPRRTSDYMGALYVALSDRARALDNPAEKDAAAARLLRIAAMREQRAVSEGTRRPAAYWRGIPRLTAEQYWSLRGMFKSGGFIEAVRAAVIDGQYDDLALILERLRPGGVLELFFSSSWLEKVTGGELVRADCGHIEYGAEVMTALNDDRTYCRRCGEEDLVYVTECRSSEEGWYHRDDVYYWESDGEYHLEPEPEPEPEDDEDDDDGLQSWGASTADLAHDRSFTPTWYGDFTMGIELEVETSDYDRWDAVRDCDWQFNRDWQYAMFKRDGSLDDSRGFEIVTAARRLTDHINMFKVWEPYDGLRSWNAECCGMHVHIDSRAFTALTLGKFLQFFNDPANARFIRSIAGRHPDMDSQAQNYAARLDCENPNPSRIKKSAGTSRYRIVNLTNLTHAEQRRLLVVADRNSKGSYSTVELRIFRGTLKKDRLLAQIEFAHAAVLFCRVAGMHQLNGRGFLAWLGSVAGQYKHLARWFGVYVPRPTKLRPTPVTTSGIQRTTEV